MNSKLKSFHFLTQQDKDSFGFDFAPILDLCVIVALFIWLSSRFTFSPGIPLDLPQSANNLQGIPCAAVLTVAGKEEMFIEGSRLKKNEIPAALRAIVQREKGKGPVALLLKMSKTSSMATLLSLCEIAQASGIESIQLASESSPEEAP